MASLVVRLSRACAGRSASASFRHLAVSSARSYPASSMSSMAMRNGSYVLVAKLYEVEGSAAGEIPSSFKQATGLERAEIENPDIFAHNDVLTGPFGTMETPTLVESAFDSRIVGCTGDEAPNDHDIYWLEVNKEEKTVCPLCEQVFALKFIGVAGDQHH